MTIDERNRVVRELEFYGAKVVSEELRIEAIDAMLDTGDVIGREYREALNLERDQSKFQLNRSVVKRDILKNMLDLGYMLDLG
jgi:hypothetical protein